MKVFVYGTLRKGFGNHRLLVRSRYICTDTVSGFDLYSLGPFPAVVANKNAKSSVTIEIYEINESTLTDLDCLEGYPRFYDRVLATSSTGEVGYIYTQKAAGASWIKIGSGDWSKYKSENQKF